QHQPDYVAGYGHDAARRLATVAGTVTDGRRQAWERGSCACGQLGAGAPRRTPLSSGLPVHRTAAAAGGRDQPGPVDRSRERPVRPTRQPVLAVAAPGRNHAEAGGRLSWTDTGR